MSNVSTEGQTNKTFCIHDECCTQSEETWNISTNIEINRILNDQIRAMIDNGTVVEKLAEFFFSVAETVEKMHNRRTKVFRGA